MNWLHASFGLGAALGPAVMTAVLGAGWSWRWGYVIAGAAQVLFAVLFGDTRSQWRLAGTEVGQASLGSPTDRVRGSATLRLPVVWFGIALFVMFTGIEGTAGQWPYTLFTDARSIAPATAGVWMSIYWASLTLGRIVFGIVGVGAGTASLLGITPAVRVCMLGVTLGSALLAWNTHDLLGFLGLALIGFWMGPLFPLQVSDTPRRVGAAHAPNAIGFQIAAASLGIAALPGLAGVLAENMGLEIIGPFLLAASIVMFLLHEVIVHRTRTARRRS
jgi:fucose permease